MKITRMLVAVLSGCLALMLSSGAMAGSYSAPALYNAANAYARSGKPGLAVLNYERARLLAPNDPDIRTNLSFVRASAGLPAQSENWFSRSVRIADPDVLAWAGLIGLAAAGISLLAGRRSSRHRFALRAVAVIGISAAGLTLCNAVAIWPSLHEAVIVAQGAAAHVAPAGNAETLFSLPEAETVAMGAEHGGFMLVRTPDGRTGWVSAADLAPVLPLH